MAIKTWEFTQSLVVDGKSYAAGDTVAEADIPAGSLQSLKRLKQVKEYTEVPPDLVAEKAPPAMAAHGKPVAPPLPPINPPVNAPAHAPMQQPHTHPAYPPAHAREKDADDDEPHKQQHPKRNK